MPSRPRPLDQLSPGMRLVIALLGLVVGLVLVFVGARSCEGSLEDPDPTVITQPPVGAN